MTEKTDAEINVHFYERIEELREDVERLKTSMTVAYDPQFHISIIQKYTAIINDAIESNLNSTDKFLVVENIKQIFEELEEYTI